MKPYRKNKHFSSYEWSKSSNTNKLLTFYVPFWHDIKITVFQPLPIPTAYKIVKIWVLFLLMMMPVIYPMTVVYLYYAVMQLVVEQQTLVKYPKYLDVVRSTNLIFSKQLTYMYRAEIAELFSKIMDINTTVITFIDYTRYVINFL